MPRKPKRQCPRPGCRGLWDGKTCTVCGREPNRDRRESAARRGYDKRWQKYREVFLAEHPLCEICKKNGTLSEANVVHHITEVQSADDPMFWNPDNHMALCRDCHEATHGRQEKFGWEK